jgi:hypothetical protein
MPKRYPSEFRRRVLDLAGAGEFLGNSSSAPVSPVHGFRPAWLGSTGRGGVSLTLVRGR